MHEAFPLHEQERIRRFLSIARPLFGASVFERIQHTVGVLFWEASGLEVARGIEMLSVEPRFGILRQRRVQIVSMAWISVVSLVPFAFKLMTVFSMA